MLCKRATIWEKLLAENALRARMSPINIAVLADHLLYRYSPFCQFCLYTPGPEWVSYMPTLQMNSCAEDCGIHFVKQFRGVRICGSGGWLCGSAGQSSFHLLILYKPSPCTSVRQVHREIFHLQCTISVCLFINTCKLKVFKAAYMIHSAGVQKYPCCCLVLSLLISLQPVIDMGRKLSVENFPKQNIS